MKLETHIISDSIIKSGACTIRYQLVTARITWKLFLRRIRRKSVAASRKAQSRATGKRTTMRRKRKLTNTNRSKPNVTVLLTRELRSRRHWWRRRQRRRRTTSSVGLVWRKKLTTSSWRLALRQGLRTRNDQLTWLVRVAKWICSARETHRSFN